VSHNLLSSAAGSFVLNRYPARKQESLHAWNSADRLLIEALYEQGLPAQSILVANDDQGALSVALRPAVTWTDSALSSIAIKKNLSLNKRPGIPIIVSTQAPEGDFTAVALKIPKLLTYLEYQLATLASVLKPGTPIIAAGMDKHLSPRIASILEHYIGPTQRHRGQLKARCFTAIKDEREAAAPPVDARYYCEALGGDLVSAANVFSREKMDIGSRFLLDHIGQLDTTYNAIDLACGNGILGLVAKANGICTNVTFCDESAMAVASASANATALCPEEEHNFGFHFGDGLLGYNGAQADLIMCNPPFHSNHTVEDYVGRRLLAQSAEHLQPSGALCLVANRHLPYLPTLKKGFARVEKLAQNKKFTIWLAQK
jgi:23S rRNA (guanine1835-N2)-methyltransferase